MAEEIATIPHSRICVALLAGGSGSRMGMDIPKPLIPIVGHPMIHYSLRVFEAIPRVHTVKVGINPLQGPVLDKILAPYPRRAYRGWVAGGPTRAHTALFTLRELASENPDIVLIHDAARPCLTEEDVLSLIDAVKGADGAFLARPCVDTLWRSSEGSVSEPVERRAVIGAQTPQAFPFKTVLDAYEKGIAEGFQGTDDASFVHRLGGKINWVTGSRWNFKVTYPEDLELARAILTGGSPCA